MSTKLCRTLANKTRYEVYKNTFYKCFSKSSDIPLFWYIIEPCLISRHNNISNIIVSTNETWNKLYLARSSNCIHHCQLRITIIIISNELHFS